MHLHINFLLSCLANNIDLSNQWIPRALNTQSDFTSKIKDCDDWQINCDFFFQELDAIGVHTHCIVSCLITIIQRLNGLSPVSGTQVARV
jgi:hypothetical protein